MCINEEVRRLGSVQRINDRCMEMQKNKHGENTRPWAHPCACGFKAFPKSCLSLSLNLSLSLWFFLSDKRPQDEGAKRRRGAAKSVCPYVGATGLQHLRDEVLGAVSDIEGLLGLGRKAKACPYYATRLAIPPAQVTHAHSFTLRC